MFKGKKYVSISMEVYSNVHKLDILCLQSHCRHFVVVGLAASHHAGCGSDVSPQRAFS